MADLRAEPGRLYYYDDVPAWGIRVPQPSRFRDAGITLEFRTFLLPKGGLLACILRLYDIPDQPFYVHRVFDPSDSSVSDYLRRSRDIPLWVLELSGGGEDPDLLRLVRLKAKDFNRNLTRILRHNKNLGKALSGPRALKEFLKAFDAAAKDGGWEAGWDAVHVKFKL